MRRKYLPKYTYERIILVVEYSVVNPWPGRFSLKLSESGPGRFGLKFSQAGPFWPAIFSGRAGLGIYNTGGDSTFDIFAKF